MLLCNILWCPAIGWGQLLKVRKSTMRRSGRKEKVWNMHLRQQESKTMWARCCVSPAAHRVGYKCRITKLKQSQSSRLCDFSPAMFSHSGSSTQRLILSGIGGLWRRTERAGIGWQALRFEQTQQGTKGWSEEFAVACSGSNDCESNSPWARKQRIIMGGIFSVRVCFWKRYPFE